MIRAAHRAIGFLSPLWRASPRWYAFAMPLAAVIAAPTVFAMSPVTLCPSPPFIIELISGGVVLAWLMSSTGLILLAVILHGTHNMSQRACSPFGAWHRSTQMPVCAAESASKGDALFRSMLDGIA